jgi:hypothetical protein
LGIIFSSSCSTIHPHKNCAPELQFFVIKVCIIQFRASVLFAWEGLHMRLYCVRIFVESRRESSIQSMYGRAECDARDVCCVRSLARVYIKRCRARPLIIILYTLLCQRWCCSVIPSTFSLWALQLRLTFSQLKHTQKTHSALTKPLTPYGISLKIDTSS